MKKAILAIMTYLVDNVEVLSKDKFSGVHLVNDFLGSGEDAYRVHVDAFIPKLFVHFTQVNKAIEAIVKVKTFSRGVEWDAQALWLTIDKDKT